MQSPRVIGLNKASVMTLPMLDERTTDCSTDDAGHERRRACHPSEGGTSYDAWLRNATKKAFPSRQLTALEHFYRKEWQRTFNQTAGTFHFLSLPWHHIVEGPLNKGPVLDRLRLARQLWTRLDWRRRHFILLNQQESRNRLSRWQRLKTAGPSRRARCRCPIPDWC